MRNQYKSFVRMFKFTKPYLPAFVTGTIFHDSQMFVFALTQSLLMSKITAAAINGTVAGIINASVFLLGMFVLFMIIMGSGIILKYTAIAKATRDFKTQLFRSFMKDSIENSISTHSGEGIAALNTDADTAASAYNNALYSLLGCVFSIVMGAVVVFSVDYRLGLASLASGGLAFIIQSRFVKPLGRISKERLAENSNTVKSVSNIFSGGLAIRAFNIQEKAFASFDAENTRLRNLSFKKAFISMWQSLITTVQGWLTLVIVFALGGWLVATEQLDFSALMLAPQMCMTISIGISGIGSAWAGLQAPAAAAERVFKLLDAGTNSETHTYQETKANDSYGLSIKNLDFKYLNGEKNALSKINLDIKENEMVAFVGASGSGKSTLLRAIIGMYDRDDMDIRLGGISFSKSNPLTWRKQFSYVDQSCKLFDMTVSENIALGAGGEVPDELIKESAIRASADVFITALPLGYETPCGERGSSLSGGQKQRIAIARALCRKAPVLVFDEATSALDTESEKNIMETIESLRKDHTILMTTHNLHNIINADKIVVMDKGHIVEIGTHGQLLKSGGLYYTLFT